MNENIDLTKILKDCPKGTELWSDNYGKVQFLKIEDTFKPIITIRTDGLTAAYTKEGWHRKDFPANCLLWPSRDCRDWSKFTAPWLKKEKFDPKTLKAFDRVIVKPDNGDWHCSILSHREDNNIYYRMIDGYGYSHVIPYNNDTKYLVGTRDEAPDFYRYWED